MPPAPNPFADEPLPMTGQRLQSAASPLNPYAAPASVGEYKAVAAPGIGIWRQGPLIVIHADTVFPNRCLITGEVTEQRRWQNVRWYYPIDWYTRTMRVGYAESATARRQIISRRNLALLTMVVGSLTLGIAIVGPDWLLPFMGGWGVLACVVGVLAGLSVAIRAGRILTFRNVQYPYFWLQGAQAPFLNSIPEWPGLGGG